jgi:hypothetical protein
LIRLQIGEGDRAIRRPEVDAKTEAFGHELKIFSCTLTNSAGEVGFTGRHRVSRHFGRRAAAYFSSTSAGAIVGSRFSSRDGGASPRTLLAR